MSRATAAACSTVATASTQGKSRTSTRASCAAYRLCAALSGLRFQSEHVSVLSRGAPRKRAAVAERPGRRARPASRQTGDDAHSACRHTARGIAASARPSDEGQDRAARRRSSASPNPSTIGGWFLFPASSPSSPASFPQAPFHSLGAHRIARSASSITSGAQLKHRLGTSSSATDRWPAS